MLKTTREMRSVETVAFQTTEPRRVCLSERELVIETRECAESAGAAPAMTIIEKTSEAKSQKRRSRRRKLDILRLSAAARVPASLVPGMPDSVP